MINTSLTTKAYSSAPQESALKADPNQRMSAEVRDQALKGGDIGSVLNQVADPGWVDPNKVRRVGNNELNKDAFFKLMLAQMKHQDPTNPLQSHEMAAQLAQFSSLEQLNNINQSLDAIKSAQNPTMNTAAIQLVGKTVHAETGQISRAVGDKVHEVRFNLKGDATDAEIAITDSTGKTIRKMAMANLKKGDNKVVWNGLQEDGQYARAGEYRINVLAKDSFGKKIAASTSFTGRITGINFTKEGPTLLVGDQSLRLSDIKKIEDDSMRAAQKASEQTGVAQILQGTMPMGPASVGGVPGASKPNPQKNTVPVMKPASPYGQSSAPASSKPQASAESDAEVPGAEPALTQDLGDVRMQGV